MYFSFLCSWMISLFSTVKSWNVKVTCLNLTSKFWKLWMEGMLIIIKLWIILVIFSQALLSWFLLSYHITLYCWWTAGDGITNKIYFDNSFFLSCVNQSMFEFEFKVKKEKNIFSSKLRNYNCTCMYSSSFFMPSIWRTLDTILTVRQCKVDQLENSNENLVQGPTRASFKIPLQSPGTSGKRLMLKCRWVIFQQY